jgi:hypothetical protein
VCDPAEAASCDVSAGTEPASRTAASEPDVRLDVAAQPEPEGLLTGSPGAPFDDGTAAGLPDAGGAGVVQLILADDEGADMGTDEGSGGASPDVPAARSRRHRTQPPSGPMARLCLVQRPRFMPSNRTA